MANEELELLREEAKDLGISFSPNIGEVKLQEKIDEYYKSQESSDEEIPAAEETLAEEKSEEKLVVASNKPKPMAQIAKELYDKASQTRVVTIIDNDQRVNNQTTTCKATWSNAYYDLGTKIFPLNTPIEIKQGFINVLKEVEIPHHIKDPKSGLSKTYMRKRFTISYEDKN